MSKFVIVTTTFYKSVKDLRYKLACSTIKNAVKQGTPIVVVDGSPNSAIHRSFKSLGAKVYPETLKGMGPSRRLAFFYGHQYLGFDMNQSDGAIVWTEPEKDDFIRFVPNMAEPIISGNADITIAERTLQCWESYPLFQQNSEREANRAYNGATGRDGYDPMSGPVGFNVEQTLGLLNFNPLDFEVPDTYIQHYLPIFHPAHRVGSVEVDFRYPEKQRAAEEAADNETIREKRKLQRETLSAAYRKLAAVPHPPK